MYMNGNDPIETRSNSRSANKNKAKVWLVLIGQYIVLVLRLNTVVLKLEKEHETKF